MYVIILLSKLTECETLLPSLTWTLRWTGDLGVILQGAKADYSWFKKKKKDTSYTLLITAMHVRRGAIWGNFCTFLSFCCEPKTALKKKNTQGRCFRLHFCFTFMNVYILGASSVAQWYRTHLQCRRCGRHRFDSWVGKIPRRKAWQPTPGF